MMRWILVASLLSCQRGGTSATVPDDLLDKRSPQGDTSVAQPTRATATVATPLELDPVTGCERFMALAAASCDWTERFPPDFHHMGTCIHSLTQWFAPETPENAKMRGVVSCWSLECGPAAACMVNIQAHSPPAPSRTCGAEGTGAIHVDRATWAGRTGAGAKRFAELATTEAAPVEVCGIEGELAWITSVKCNDGSNPYGSIAVAHDSRDSWMARGGKCNSILDRFSVKCPEATYRVHVDRYVCPRDP